MNADKPLTMTGKDIDQLATTVLSMNHLIRRALASLNLAVSDLEEAIEDKDPTFVRANLLQVKLILKEAIGE